MSYMIKDLARNERGRYFYPPDFMQPSMDFHDQHFVGYEASARLSEIAKEYPEIVESRRRGKYMERRLKVEVLQEQSLKIGGTLGEFIRAEIVRHGIKKSNPSELF